VLQERELERVGGSRTIKVDVRVIATTNRRLDQSVARKEFREDLFFRLNVVPILVPPLRDRREDVLFLAERFLVSSARKHGCAAQRLSDECRRILSAHNWPGNVRELQNVIERAVILGGDSPLVGTAHLCLTGVPGSLPSVPEPALVAAPNAPGPAIAEDFPTLARLEQHHILAALDRCRNNRTQAAKILDISVRTLRNKLHEYQGVPGTRQTENGGCSPKEDPDGAAAAEPRRTAQPA
jgi:transcriptional regulator with PAS, ATPase and Fis domain